MELTKITKIGGSLGIILDKSIATKIFGWEEGTPIDIDYDILNKRVVIIQKNGAKG